MVKAPNIFVLYILYIVSERVIDTIGLVIIYCQAKV